MHVHNPLSMIRAHLPLHDDFLQGLEHRFALC